VGAQREQSIGCTERRVNWETKHRWVHRVNRALGDQREENRVNGESEHKWVSNYVFTPLLILEMCVFRVLDAIAYWITTIQIFILTLSRQHEMCYYDDKNETIRFGGHQYEFTNSAPSNMARMKWISECKRVFKQRTQVASLITFICQTYTANGNEKNWK